MEAETFQVVAVLLFKNLPAETNQRGNYTNFFCLNSIKKIPHYEISLVFYVFPNHKSLYSLISQKHTRTHKKILATNYQLVFSLQQEMIINNYTLAHRRHSTRGHYLGDNEAF